MNCTPHPVLLGNKTRKNKMGGACSANGERRGIYRVLEGEPKKKRSLGRPRLQGRIILR
jgi:hypothetical protein